LKKPWIISNWVSREKRWKNKKIKNRPTLCFKP
jgi:hypothetical protein